MLLKALLDLANISSTLLNWLFASQAIKDMETCELASTQLPKDRKEWKTELPEDLCNAHISRGTYSKLILTSLAQT